MKTFAFFDFDGTLTHTDMVLPFLQYYCANNVRFYAKLLRQSPILLAYLAGYASNLRAKEAVFREFLAGHNTEHVQQIAREFAQHKLPELLLPQGMEKLHQHHSNMAMCAR